MLFTLGEAVKSGSNWQTILAWGGWCSIKKSVLAMEMEEENACH